MVAGKTPPAAGEPITVGEDGTIDNPITAAAGMRYFRTKYYLDGGKTYKCIRDDSNGQARFYSIFRRNLWAFTSRR